MAMTPEQLQQVMAIVATTLQQTLAAAGVGGGTNDRAGEDEWKAWEFDFKVSARAADAYLVEAMEVDEMESKDITAADFSELEDQKWDGLEDKSRQLYDVLCMLTFGEAKSVIREVLGGDGIVHGKHLPKAVLEGLWRGC